VKTPGGSDPWSIDIGTNMYQLHLKTRWKDGPLDGRKSNEKNGASDTKINVKKIGN